MRNVQTTGGTVSFNTKFVDRTHAQLTPSGDAYTNTVDPTTNYGAN